MDFFSGLPMVATPSSVPTAAPQRCSFSTKVVACAASRRWPLATASANRRPRAARRTARQEDRLRRGRRPARRSDLARAHAQPALRPGRSPRLSWPPDGPPCELDPASEPSTNLIRPQPAMERGAQLQPTTKGVADPHHAAQQPAPLDGEPLSFFRPERSRLVVLALRPSTPAPREQRQPEREQRAEATDSEAHGIPAGPVFRLRRGLRLER